MICPNCGKDTSGGKKCKWCGSSTLFAERMSYVPAPSPLSSLPVMNSESAQAPSKNYQYAQPAVQAPEKTARAESVPVYPVQTGFGAAENSVSPTRPIYDARGASSPIPSRESQAKSRRKKVSPFIYVCAFLAAAFVTVLLIALSLSGKNNELHTELLGKEAKIKELSEQVPEVSENPGATETDISDTSVPEEKLEAANKTIDQLEKDKADLEKKVADLEEELKKAQGEDEEEDISVDASGSDLQIEPDDSETEESEEDHSWQDKPGEDGSGDNDTSGNNVRR